MKTNLSQSLPFQKQKSKIWNTQQFYTQDSDEALASRSAVQKIRLEGRY